MTSRRSLVALTLGLGTVMAVGTFLGFAFGVLAPFLVDDLGLSAVAVGLLPSVMYAVAAVVAGRVGLVVDRVGTARSLRSVPLLVAAAALLAAAAPGYAVVLAAALFAGLPLAATNPTTNRVVSAALPAGSRGPVMGWKQAGVAGGSVAAGVGLPPLAAAIGWRAALLVAAGCCLLVAVALRAVRLPTTAGVAASATPAAGEAKVIDLDLFAVLMGMANGAVATYLVLFAVVELAFSPQRAGVAAALMGAVSVAARVAWAWSADRTGRPVMSLAALALVAVSGGVVAVTAAVSGATAALWPAAVLLGASATAWPGLLMLAAVDRVPLARAGQVSGRLTRSFYAGYVAGPIGFGLLVDHVAGGFRAGWVGVVVAAAAAGLALTTGTGRRSHRHHRAVRPRIDGAD